MQLRGFRFHSDIYLRTGNESFDLHNCFDFAGFAYDIAKRTVTLRWVPNRHAPAGEQRLMVVEFQGVSHFSAEPRDPAVPFTEDDCLSGVRYVPANAPTSAGFPCEEASPDFHCVFDFMSGFSLRVFGESAMVRIK